MDITAEKLAALVNQAENLLDSIEFQLECDLSKRAGKQIKPVNVYKNIEDARRELKELRNEKDSLMNLQEELKEKFTNKSQVVCKQLQDMEKHIERRNKPSSNARSLIMTRLRM